MPMLPSREPAKRLPRSDFDVEAFRVQVWNQGMTVLWEQYTMCPCGQRLDNYGTVAMDFTALGPTKLTGEPKTTCVTCSGKGYILRDPQQIKALVFAQAMQSRRFGTNGDMDSGACRATFLPENKPSDGDRITLLDSVHVVREKAFRRGNTQALRFPVATQVQDLQSGNTPVSVLTILRAGLNNVTDPVPLVQGTDFTVDAQGRIVWSTATGNRAPVEGAQFSVEYYAKPRYVVDGASHHVRDTFVGFKQIVPTHKVMTISATLKPEWKGELSAP